MSAIVRTVVPRPTRQALRERAGGACERCGATGAGYQGRAFLTIHHRRGFAEGHALDNLELLCGECHSGHHTRERRVSRGKDPDQHSGHTSFRLSAAARAALDSLCERRNQQRTALLENLILEEDLRAELDEVKARVARLEGKAP